MEKLTSNCLIELFTFFSFSSAKLNTCFSWKENVKKCTSFEEQKGTRYIWGNIYFGIIVFNSLSFKKLCLEFLFICFALEILLDFMSKWGWFHIHDVHFPKNLSSRLKFKKLKHSFVDNIKIILSLEIPCTFLLAKKDLKTHF